MIDRKHNLAISKQAEALNISRGSVYYLPRPVPKTELAPSAHHHTGAWPQDLPVFAAGH